jgi:hypothetical protein
MKKNIFSCLVALVAVAALIFNAPLAISQFQTILPGIVYQHAWLGQTASVPSTTVFTPSVNGLFRATYSVLVSTGGSFSVITYLSTGTQFGCSGNWNTDVSNQNQSTCVFVGQSGIPVTFYANVEGNIGSAHFDPYLTIEQLQ